jgi:hypothetical protein
MDAGRPLMDRASACRGLAIAAVLAALLGCAHGPRQMYQWGAFPHQQYDALRGDGQSPADQILALEAQSEKTTAAHAALPPGFRAHLGMLYLDAGDPDKARALWLAEEAAFPESSPYIDQLLKRLEGPAKTAQAKGAAA